MHDVSSPHLFVILHYLPLHILLKNTQQKYFTADQSDEIQHIPFVSHLINV